MDSENIDFFFLYTTNIANPACLGTDIRLYNTEGTELPVNQTIAGYSEIELV